MSRLISHCPTCGKVAKLSLELRSNLFNTDTMQFDTVQYHKILTCGHSVFEQVHINKVNAFSSLDGNKLAYDYQVEGIEFILNTDCNCLLADGMGLGKTSQAINACRLAAASRILVILKGATTFQWVRAWREWGSDHDLSTWPIIGSKSFIPPGFQTYFIPMDTFSKTGMAEKLALYGIDCVIVDECHSFKDPYAKRSMALTKFIKLSGVKHKIFLSGTPIKNRASEYFTVLNILDPITFPSLENFTYKWLDSDGKRILPWKLQQFRDLTSRYILRREKHEVQKDLPPFRRDFINLKINDPEIKKAYNHQLDLFEQFMNEKGKHNSMSALAEMTKLRKITALAKIPFTLDLLEEFLENTDDDKIAVGIHHHAVRDELYLTMKIKGHNPLKLSGEDSSWQKDQIVSDFAKPEHRILIISTLAGGVGLNGLQVCNAPIVIERQWSSADEEQFEARFHRNGQDKPVTCTYLIIEGTIDQYFHELVESKREIFGETVSNEEYNLTNDRESILELADRTIAGRL